MFKKFGIVLFVIFVFSMGWYCGSEGNVQTVPQAIADITDEPENDTSLQEAATSVRGRMRNSLLVVSSDMKSVNEKVIEFGKAELAAEINKNNPGDAAQMQAIYNSFKGTVNAVFGEAGTKPNPNHVIPNLP